MPWTWTPPLTPIHPYTFTSVYGQDYPVHCVALETRVNQSTQKRGEKTIVRSLNPAKSMFGDLIAPRPCYPVSVGLGPDLPIEGVLHGQTLRLECMIWCPRYAPQGCVAYHVIDLETYQALGGLLGRGAEWPVPMLPYSPAKPCTFTNLPRDLFDHCGQFRLAPSDN